MLTENSNSSLREGSLAAACGAVLVLIVVVASAIAIVRPLPSVLPGGTEVSPSDSAGVNLLEPASTSIASAPKAQPSNNESVERVVSEWTPTGGGPGGHGSPKK